MKLPKQVAALLGYSTQQTRVNLYFQHAIAGVKPSIEGGGGRIVPLATGEPVTGQCYFFLGCNDSYALYDYGDTYGQCVARRRESDAPHSWRGEGLGCVDIP